MKTQGEIEAAICEGIAQFEQEYMGRGPKDIHTHLIGDLLVVRLQGVLTAAEQQLVRTLPAEKGRDLLKQVRPEWFPRHGPIVEQLQKGSGKLLKEWLKSLGCPYDREAKASTLALQGLLTAAEVREAQGQLIGIGGEVRELMGQTLRLSSHAERVAFVERVKGLKEQGNER